MKTPILFAALMGLSVSMVQAQSTELTAMDVAQSQNACGDGTIISARFLDNGQVGVQCTAPSAGAFNCVPFANAVSEDSDFEALRIAEAQNACGDRNIVSAQFVNGGQVSVQCISASAAGGSCPAGTAFLGTATNFAPIAVGLVATAVLGAVASGGGSSTSDTR